MSKMIPKICRIDMRLSDSYVIETFFFIGLKLLKRHFILRGQFKVSNSSVCFGNVGVNPEFGRRDGKTLGGKGGHLLGVGATTEAGIAGLHNSFAHR